MFADLFQRVAIAYIEKAKYSEAIAALEPLLLNEETDVPSTWSILGKAHELQGNLEDAVTFYESGKM